MSYKPPRTPTPPPAKNATGKPAPKNPPAPRPLSDAQIKTLPVGGSSRMAIEKATGGHAEKIGRRSMDNTFALNLWGRRFVYVRNQEKGAGRQTAYGTEGLRKAIAPDAANQGKQLDHTASTAIEGGRMGNKYSLASLVPADVNQSHGRTNEKGPAPTREAAKAFQGGIDRQGKHHVSYMTNEMAQKLAGQPSQGKGHSTLQRTLTEKERRAISSSLLQDRQSQQRLRVLTKQPEPAKSRPIQQTIAKSKGRSR